jgi:hypothetical protein
MALQEPPFLVPFVDQKTGLVTSIWQLWLISAWQGQNGSAPLASPVFTGTPQAPTASALTNNSQIATTGYADSAVTVEENRAKAAENALGSSVSTLDTEVSAVATNLAAETARAEAAEALLAPKNNPVFTGTITTPAIDITGPEAIGNGADVNIQAPAQGTGTGPASPGVVIGWIPIGAGGYVPVCL